MDNDKVENLEVRYLGDVARLELRPNDYVVLTVEGGLTRDFVDLLHKQLSAFFTHNKVMILSEGMKLGVIGPPKED